MRKYITLVLAIVLLATSCKAVVNNNDIKNTDSTNNKTMDNKLYMTTVNVGYGDCIILQYNDTTCMIDTGHEEKIASVVGAMKLLGIKKIDALFLTHTHDDHIGGVPTLSKNYTIEKSYSATISRTKLGKKNKIKKLVDKYELNHTLLNTGDKVNVGPLAFDVLGPTRLDEEEENNNSLVLKLNINGKSILLTGDMEFPEEQDLIAKKLDLKSDILKVANHGNPDATSDQFAKLVSPSVAVITTSREDDDNSANERVITSLGCKTYITDESQNGIQIIVDETGKIDVEKLTSKNEPFNIELLDVDDDKNSFTLINHGKKCDISGFVFVSENHNYIFPTGSIIDKNEKQIKACKNEDYGALYDSYGNKVSEISWN